MWDFRNSKTAYKYALSQGPSDKNCKKRKADEFQGLRWKEYIYSEVIISCERGLIFGPSDFKIANQTQGEIHTFVLMGYLPLHKFFLTSLFCMDCIDHFELSMYWKDQFSNESSFWSYRQRRLDKYQFAIDMTSFSIFSSDFLAAFWKTGMTTVKNTALQ